MLRFAPFSSNVHPAFWKNFTDLKLNRLCLSEDPVECIGSYANNAAKGTLEQVNIDWTAFYEKHPEVHWDEYRIFGKVLNKNTLEAFKECNKRDLLEEEGKIVWRHIISGRAVKEPQLLSRFVVLMFADAKKYSYYYWFAFPALSLPFEVSVSSEMCSLSSRFSADFCKSLAEGYKIWKKSNSLSSGYFAFNEKSGEILSLSDALKQTDALIAFADPSTMSNCPGWPLRNLLCLIAYHCPDRLKTGMSICCLRQDSVNGVLSVKDSYTIGVIAPELSPLDPNCTLNCVGWEKNSQGKVLPKHLNLKTTMDPKELASSSVDLNLKLMKWRLAPQLDLDVFKNTRCLLLGSGTLGCNVARCLMGWGVRKLTFVDNGRVSFSNPVRQSLFTFDDCLEGGTHKAKAAAEMVQKIFPNMESDWHHLTVPMPGHRISETLVEEVQTHYKELETLIKSHDVIYLLMDSRESRWLPTVMAAYYGKLVINAALGFDSYVVMRHGVRDKTSFSQPDSCVPANNPLVPGNMLGCYFCNDVVAPGNSTRDRALDQQCTVTRPGVSYMAAAQAVELMASVLQHPSLALAPSSTKPVDSLSVDVEGTLGYVPHSIRGSVHGFIQFLPTTKLYRHCTACSHTVLEQFGENGFKFLLNACDNPKYLEDLTGITELMGEDTMQELVALDDNSDLDDSDVS